MTIIHKVPALTLVLLLALLAGAADAQGTTSDLTDLQIDVIHYDGHVQQLVSTILTNRTVAPDDLTHAYQLVSQYGSLADCITAKLDRVQRDLRGARAANRDVLPYLQLARFLSSLHARADSAHFIATLIATQQALDDQGASTNYLTMALLLQSEASALSDLLGEQPNVQHLRSSY